MPLLRDRVRETTTTVGTGTITLGGAVTGYQSFNTAFTNGDTTYYVIQGGTEWEIGIGTIGAGTLARTTVLQSSNADALVPFAAGTKDVFCSYVADRAVTTSDAATLTNKTLDDYTNNIGANSTHFRIKATGTISKGQVVKATGFTPGENAIEVAVVTSATDLALGIAESALTTGQFGLAVVIGELFDVNTNGLSVGAIIYSNGTGGYTTTKPSSGTYQPLGWVVRANLNTGVIAVNIVAPLYVETSTNTANTAVLRDGSGNFAAGTLTLAGLSVDSPTLVVDAANDRVGIGTTSPIAQLANTNGTDGISSANSTGLAWRSTANEWAGVIISRPASGLTYGLRVHAGGTSASDYPLWISSGAGSGSGLLAVTGAGNVGIGTTSPSARLEVVGNYRQKALVGNSNGFNLTIDSATDVVTVSNFYNAAIVFATNNTNRWQISAGGSLLASTDASFDIGASGANRPRDLYLSRNAFVAGYAQSLTRGINGGFRLPDWFIYNTTSGNALLIEQGSNFVRINSDGSVGINATPGAVDSGGALFLAGGREIIWGSQTGYLSANARFSGGNDLYIANGSASRYLQTTGQHRWFTAPSGTAGGTISFTESMRLDASGNLGLGVTPSAWNVSGAGGPIVQIARGAYFGNNNEVDLLHNAYYNVTFKYIASSVAATRYEQNTGQHRWYNAPAGTADANITFTQAMTLDASGRLGLGTTTPDIFSRGYGGTILGISGASQNALVINSGTGAAFFEMGAGGTRTLSVSANATAAQFGSVGALPLIFATNGTERWRISDTGHLLAGADATYDIGASGANRPRNLYLGKLTLTQDTPFYTGANIHAANSIGIGTTSAALLGFWTNNTERMRIESGGNVGIGTTSPSVNLAVYNATAPKLHLQNSTSGITASDGLQLSLVSTDAYLWNYENGPLIFGTNGGERMRLDASGNLGLGVVPSAWTITPALQVSRGSVMNTSSDQTYFTSNAFFGSLGWTYIDSDFAEQYLQVAGGHRWYSAPSGTAGAAVTFTERMRLDDAGNLGLGVTPQAWGSTIKAFEQPAGAVASLSTTQQYIMQNLAFIGGSWLYKDSAAGSFYRQQAGAHAWITAPAGTAGAVASLTTAMTLDASGNLGLGVTPSAWSGYTAMQIGGGAVYGIASRRIGFTANAFGPSFGNFTYVSTNPAGRYEIDANTHQWFTAPSGTAGNAITFTQAMTLDASGRLMVGTTSPSGLVTFSQNQNATTTVVVLNADLGSSASSRLQLDTAGGGGYVEVRRSGGTMVFNVNAADRWQITNTGHLLAGADATYDIGASGANRPRNVFVSGTVTAGNQTASATAGTIQLRGPTSTVMEAAVRPNAGSDGWLTFTESTVADRWAIGIATGSDALRFVSGTYAGTERMRITAAGNVGIGTTAPGAQLDVLGSTDYATVQLTRTKSTGDQRVAVLGQHYTNTEEAVLLTGMLSNSTSNRMFIGGASTSYNSATSIEFYTGATNTSTSGTERMRVDNTTTAGQTALLLWDVDNGTLERVTVGAADSGGVGFKVLRIPN